MSFVDFSSWPRDQEQSFVVYEQRSSESTKKAFSIGAVAGAIFLVFMVGIYAGVKPDIKEVKGMNMENLTKKSKKSAPAEKPAEAPAPAPAPAPDPAPAAAPAPAEGAAPAAPAE